MSPVTAALLGVIVGGCVVVGALAAFFHAIGTGDDNDCDTLRIAVDAFVHDPAIVDLAAESDTIEAHRARLRRCLTNTTRSDQ